MGDNDKLFVEVDGVRLFVGRNGDVERERCGFNEFDAGVAGLRSLLGLFALLIFDEPRPGGVGVAVNAPFT